MRMWEFDVARPNEPMSRWRAWFVLSDCPRVVRAFTSAYGVVSCHEITMKEGREKMKLTELVGVSGSDECLTLRDGSPCLIGAKVRQDWSCCVCRSILEWRHRGIWRSVFVRETGPRSAYVFPGNAVQDASSCIVQMDFDCTSDPEIRRTINALLLAMVAVSIYDCEGDCSVELVSRTEPDNARNVVTCQRC